MYKQERFPAVIGILLATAMSFAAPGTIIYQGSVLQPNGVPISDGDYPMRFSLFVVPSGGTWVWQETSPTVPVRNGHFSIMLGTVTPFGTLFSTRSELWLEVWIDLDRNGVFASAERYAPRQKLVSVPWAIEADTLDGWHGSMFWRTVGNSGTTAGTHFLGTTDNKPVEVRVNNMRALQILPTGAAPILIGGADSNSAAPSAAGAFIGGGEKQRANGLYATLGGGRNNLAQTSATVGGGSNNSASGAASVIGGGTWNFATGNFATIGGGSASSATASYSTIGGGHRNKAGAGQATVGGGGNNIASGTESCVGGGANNWATGRASTISGGAVNRAAGNEATISGGTFNSAGGDASFLGGGSRNKADANYAVVAGGRENASTATYATVGGGLRNKAQQTFAVIAGGQDNITTASYGVVSGGHNNKGYGSFSTISGGGFGTASGEYSSIGGGFHNTVTGDYAHVGGGSYHVMSGNYAALGGGFNNCVTVTGRNAFIGAGSENVVSGNSAIVGGGSRNHASGSHSAVVGGEDNETSGNDAVIGGGWFNSASGPYAAIGGGNSNRAVGDCSIIPGGNRNFTGGFGSFAAGNFAHAAHRGCFVWGDSQSGSYTTSTAQDQFIVRAKGRIFLTSTIGALPANNGFINTSTGGYLSVGGVWTDSCDRNTKENFTPVDARDILSRLDQLPITRWNYKEEGPAVQHLGPVAQDFHALFDLGQDDLHIATLDANGVALAAIQGLHRIVREKDAEIAELKTRLATLEEAVKVLTREYPLAMEGQTGPVGRQ
ncbi:MAG: tail fiber domain-containing protein [Candidatus Sumerlaeia bacterium]|nr:tail fiber domain-containing protein [Candidatus Sumerlaeia bacterium]